MPSSNAQLFIDFDGTIATNDVGDELFKTFGEFEPVHTQLLDGQFGVAEYYQRSAALLRHDVTLHTVREFAARQHVDPGFASLLRLCASHGVDVTVVSDGFDVYIEPILEPYRHDIANVMCNTLSYDEHQRRWTPTFPGASESCTCFCASCKRNVLLTTAGPNDVIIYIGDGRSDRCAVQHADVVFAKGGLRTWCSTNGVPHHPIHGLGEACSILERRLRTGDLRPRKQAEVARKHAFQAE